MKDDASRALNFLRAVYFPHCLISLIDPSFLHPFKHPRESLPTHPTSLANVVEQDLTSSKKGTYLQPFDTHLGLLG